MCTVKLLKISTAPQYNGIICLKFSGIEYTYACSFHTDLPTADHSGSVVPSLTPERDGGRHKDPGGRSEEGEAQLHIHVECSYKDILSRGYHVSCLQTAMVCKD